MKSASLFRLTYGLTCLAAAAILATCGAQAAKSTSANANNGFYDSAVRLIEKGDLKGAIIELKNSLQADPDDLSARILLGQTYLKAQDGASAAKELLRARRDGARDRFVLVPLGRAYLMHGYYKKVLSEIRASGQDDKITANIETIRGDAYFALQNYDAAEKAYLLATKADPDNVKALAGLARLKLNIGDLSAAKRYANWALDSNKEDSDSWYLQGEIARLLRDSDKALASYDRAIELAPHSTPVRLARAGLLIKLGQFDRAEADIIKAREANPRIPRIFYLHSLILSHRGAAQKAKEALTEANIILQSLPGEIVRSHPPTMFLSGIVSYFLGKEDAAYGHLTRYLERAPYHDGARVMLASIALKRGETALALKNLEPIAPYLKNDIEFLTLISDALIKARRQEDAAEFLAKATKIAKPGTPVLTKIVSLYLLAGRDDGAIAILKAELARAPETLAPAVTLTTTYMRRKQFKAALQTINAFIERHPDNPAVFNLAAGAHLGLGEIEAARATFLKAIQVKPDYIPAIFNLAKLEGGTGNVGAARRYFSRILELDPKNGEVMLTLSRLHVQEKDTDGAIRWLEKARAESRQSNEATVRLINLNLKIGRADEAVRLAQRLQRENPSNLLYLATFGRAQLGAKELAKATESFRQLANRATEEKSPAWLRQAAIWLNQVRDPASARAALESALRIDERFLPAQFELFKLDLAAGYLDAAMARANRVAVLTPGKSASDELKGDVYMRRRQFNEATRAYTTAFSKSPNTSLANKVYQAKRAAGSSGLSFITAWANKHKNDDATQRILALAYMHAGRHKDAIQLTERLLGSAPNDLDLLNNAAFLYHKLNDSRALEFAERAYAAAPNQPIIMDTYGWVLISNGRTSEGLRILRNARLRAPDVPDIRYHIAVALNDLGRTVEALSEVRAAIDYGLPFEGIKDARLLLAALSSKGR